MQLLNSNNKKIKNSLVVKYEVASFHLYKYCFLQLNFDYNSVEIENFGNEMLMGCLNMLKTLMLTSHLAWLNERIKTR